MPSPYWIKLFHELLDDAETAQLPDRLWRRMIECFLLAGDYERDGELPSLNTMAWRLRLSEEILESDLVELAKVGIVEQVASVWVVPKFDERQTASSTMRVRRYRKKQQEKSLREQYLMTIEDDM